MFEWLIPILIVALLLLWILDYLGMLEVVGAVLELIGAVIAGVAKLAAYFDSPVDRIFKTSALSVGAQPPGASVVGNGSPGR